ncbi:Abi family protein [Tindallia californiensis]|nr:Abi family protein [Tindallia californiensis]
MTLKIPIWMLVEVMTFGEVLQLYKLMSNKNRESISNEFKCTPTELESWLNGLKFARNKCAHNANVIDLKLKTKTKLRNEWKKYIYIEAKNNQSTGGLSDIIIPMVHLTTKINESFQFNEIQKAINTIGDRDDENAIKLGFANAYASAHAISDMGGHFNQNYNSKQMKNCL